MSNQSVFHLNLARFRCAIEMKYLVLPMLWASVSMPIMAEPYEPCDASSIAEIQKPYKPTQLEASKFLAANKEAILASGHASEITLFINKQQNSPDWKLLDPTFEFRREYEGLKLLRLNTGVNILVGGSDPAPGGFSPNVPPESLQVLVKNSNKGDCVRPIDSSDYRAKGAIGHPGNAKFVVDYQGFGEIVLIVKRDDASNNAVKAYCSGVIVDINGKMASILTAAHCLADKNSTALKFENHISEQASPFRILLPRDKQHPGTPAEFKNCLNGDTGNCAYNVGKINSIPEFAPGSFRSNSSKADFIANDIALLYAEFQTPPERYAQILNPIDLHTKDKEYVLMHAGYGRNEKALEGGTLRIGPLLMTQPLQKDQYDQISVKHDLKNNPGSNACQFDSGSPVFDGQSNGKEESPRRLLGLITRVSGGEGSSTCKQSGEEVIQAISPAVLRWLCLPDSSNKSPRLSRCMPPSK